MFVVFNFFIVYYQDIWFVYAELLHQFLSFTYVITLNKKLEHVFIEPLSCLFNIL